MDTTCPDCGKHYAIDTKWVGKRVKCKACGNVFEIPVELGEESEGGEGATAAAGFDDLAALAALEKTGTFEETPIVSDSMLRSMRQEKETAARERQTAQAQSLNDASGASRPSRKRSINPYSWPSRSSRFELSNPLSELRYKWVPLALILLCYCLPKLIQTVGLIHEFHEVPSDEYGEVAMMLFFEVLGIILLIAVTIPIAVFGLRIAAQMRKFQLDDLPGTRLFAAYCAAPLGLGLYFIISGIAQSSGLLPSSPGTAAAVLQRFIGGLAAAAVTSIFLIWLFFGLRVVDAIVAWFFSLIFYAIGSGVTSLIIFCILYVWAGLHSPSKPPDSQDIAQSSQTQPPQTPPAPPIMPVIHSPDWQKVPVQPQVPEAETSLEPRTQPDGLPIPPPPVESRPAHPHLSPEQPRQLALLARVTAEPLGQNPVAILTSALPSPWVVVVTQAESGPDKASDNLTRGLHHRSGYAWTRYNSHDWKPAGSLWFEDPTIDSAIISPDAHYLVGLSHHPGESIEIWSYATGKIEHSIDARDVRSLAGFVDKDTFGVFGGSGRSQFVLVSASSGKKVRELPLDINSGRFGRELAISGDGAILAAVCSQDFTPQVVLYNTAGGLRQRWTLPGMERGIIDAQGCAFSGDNRMLAVMVRRARATSVYCYQVADGKLLFHRDYQSHALNLGFGDAGRMCWLPDNRLLALSGWAILDTETGRFIGTCVDLPKGNAPDVRLLHPLDSGKMLAITNDMGTRIHVLELDDQAIHRALDAARTAGPLMLMPPPIVTPQWPAAVASKSDQSVHRGMPVDPISGPAADARQLASAIALDCPCSRVGSVFFYGGAPKSIGDTGPSAIIVNSPQSRDAAQEDAQAGLPWQQNLADDSELASDAGNRLLRYSLVTGKLTASTAIPTACRCLAVSPDGQLALLGSSSGDQFFHNEIDRLDLWRIETPPRAGDPPRTAQGASTRASTPASTRSSPPLANISGGSPLIGWIPYQAADPKSHAVLWATMPDKDGVITRNDNLLIRWSIFGHEAVWGRQDVSCNPAVSPGGRYLVVLQNKKLLGIDARNGDAVGSFDSAPLEGAELHHMQFSRDGLALFAQTSAGLVRWEVATGQGALVIPQAAVDQALKDAAGQKAADGMEDTDAEDAINTPVSAGLSIHHHIHRRLPQNVSPAPAGLNGTSSDISSNATKTATCVAADDADNNTLEDENDNFILLQDVLLDPTRPVAAFLYNASGGRNLHQDSVARHWYLARRAADGAPFLCSTRLPLPADASAIDKFAAAPPPIRRGVQVALQVSASADTDTITKILADQIKANGLDSGPQAATLRVSVQMVSTDFSRGGMKATQYRYECFYDLVDPSGAALYGSPKLILTGYAGQRLHEMMLQWVREIYVPANMTSDGHPLPAPESSLGVGS